MPNAATAPIVGFDLDMTLVDSSAGIAATFRAALAELGREVSAEQVWPLVGIPLEAMARSLVPDLDPGPVTRRYRELYPERGVDSVTPLPGAFDAFDAVHAAGGRVLVVSAKVETGLRAVLKHVGLDRHADEVVGGLFAEGKGGALRAHGAQAYVGDHPGDVTAARSAGAVAVGVATGPFSAEQLLASGSDVVLADLTEFPAWLDRFLDRGLSDRGAVLPG